ncbi:MAG: hypothetical protein NT098_02280 [Candidatus Parcubacteria bacterium]|nr:hypothetical protein [Candidatus Parcubacteria bacterium]
MDYTDFRDYLKKVAEAKKHRNEYLKKGIKVYERLLSIGLVGMTASTATILFVLATPHKYGINPDTVENFLLSIFTLFTILIMFSTISGLIKKGKNEKEFSEKFPKEASLILEYEEIIKEEN